MKSLILLFCTLVLGSLFGQQRINPVIKSAGGVFEVPDAVEMPDPTLDYKIAIELFAPSDDPKEINQALNSVARLVNLHVMGGVPKEKLAIVVAIHGEATYTLTNSKAYEKRYKTQNPNLVVYEELSNAGVKFFVCGQSLMARGVDRSTLIPQVKIATSMLTTITTHQLKGYAYLKF